MRVFGTGEPRVTIRFTDRLAVFQLCLNPLLYLGELYTDGRLVIDQGDVATLLWMLTRNMAAAKVPGPARLLRPLRRVLRRIEQRNWAASSRANVAHHYDLSEELYRLFLDDDRQYSCAYFSRPGMSLDEAQAAKKRHIAAKLALDRPGLSVLDIGCGWGGLALDLARLSGAEVKGITLSQEQFAVAQQRGARAGAAVGFELIDYRALGGSFDRIVSVGMFEHVGLPQYRDFFAAAARLLKPDGVMLLHTIGRSDGPGSTNPWIAKYIFPGGYIPALSEILPFIEQAGLMVTDIEVLRLHYAETLKAWREKFESVRAQVAALYDERFCRMWEFYLAGSEMAFRNEAMVIFQIQIARRVDALPLTRDYMVDGERAFAAQELEDQRPPSPQSQRSFRVA